MSIAWLQHKAVYHVAAHEAISRFVSSNVLYHPNLADIAQYGQVNLVTFLQELSNQ